MKPIIIEVLLDVDYPICIDFEEENSIIIDVLEEEILIIG